MIEGIVASQNAINSSRSSIFINQLQPNIDDIAISNQSNGFWIKLQGRFDEEVAK